MPVVVSGRAGVASGHPVAAEHGLAVLGAGGSSVDAALAMAFTQWVVNAPLCGPGGDLVLLHVGPAGAMVYGGWSRCPAALDPSAPLAYDGPGAAVVPGGPAGARAAWTAAGQLPWPRLFDGALDAADGHLVTSWMARSYAGVVARGHGDALSAVLDESDPPAPGSTASTKRLGLSLRALAADAHSLYRGELARSLVAAAREAGAALRAEDLAAVEAEVRPAEVEHLDGITIAYPAPPSQASITARLLAAASPGDRPESRRFAEAVAPVAMEELIRRCTVGLAGTAASVACDGASAAVVVHSLAGVQFGSGWVAGDTGIALGNRVGTALSTRADLPAANPVPGGTLPHTLSAAWLRARGRSVVLATPGGDRQVQWLAQAAQRLRRDESLERLVSGPRWFVCPEGDRFGVPQGIGEEWFAFAEPGIDWSADEQVRGYRVRPVDSVGGGLQAVELLEGGGCQLASDPRAGGEALATGGDDVRGA